ncbi:MAG: hypothetical protein LIP18_00335 [Planctomycetes bacterium]|nr:hypothetical protein [Planctomycetota bacterium]
MIGRFNIDSPPIDDSLSQMVESHRAKTGQDYGAILLFGLWGTVDCSAEVRLYAAYRHLESNPEDGPAWLETARVHQEQGETEQAFAILDELERLGTPGLYPNLFSEDPEAHRAAILADSGRLDAALEILDRLRAEHGETPAYHYLVGTILQVQENWTGAVAAYEAAAASLDAFRREAEEEDVIEEMSVDFPAAREFIDARIGEAKREVRFSGDRPMDLSGFRVE